MLGDKYVSYCGITQEYAIHKTAEEAKEELAENYKNPDYAVDREDYTDGFIAEIKWRAFLKTYEEKNQGTVVEPQFAGLEEFLKRDKAKKAFKEICNLLEDDETRILLDHYASNEMERLREWLKKTMPKK